MKSALVQAAQVLRPSFVGRDADADTHADAHTDTDLDTCAADTHPSNGWHGHADALWFGDHDLRRRVGEWLGRLVEQRHGQPEQRVTRASRHPVDLGDVCRGVEWHGDVQDV